MRMFLLAFMALAGAAVHTPATATMQDAAERAERQSLDAAAALIRSNKPDDAIAVLDRLITAKESEVKDRSRKVYCSRTPVETLFYMGEAASQQRSAVAVGPNWCNAIFMKGFALVDLGRHREAREWLQKASDMAPRNAHYRGELAESYKTERNWAKAFELFEQAADDARIYSPESSKVQELGRGLRGMGFTLIELGRLDEARKLFEQALALNPDDATAKSELQYISEQQSKRAPS